VNAGPAEATEVDPSYSAALNDRALRLAIAYDFVKVLGCPPEAEWEGVDGTISTIQQALKMQKGSRNTIKAVLLKVLACHEEGIIYSGDIESGSGGQTKLIVLGSVEEQIAANTIESGLGYLQATHDVNQYRAAQAYAGTQYESTWLVYHDALSSLTSGETQEWMKVKNTADGRSFHDCMNNPLNGLNAGTAYNGRPVGNSTEMMPLDSSLFKDSDDCIGRHVSSCNSMKPSQ